MLLKPWDERKRSSIKLKPLVQAQLSKIEGVNAFAFNLPPLPGGPGGLPVQMVINSTSGFQSVYEQMDKLKDAARKSGLFIVSDSDLDFNQPVVRVKIDRSKASDLGITMQQIGNTLATLLGGNYVNRFNLEGRSYQVIPQVPREHPPVAGSARRVIMCRPRPASRCRCRPWCRSRPATDPNALTHYNQLNSATFQAVPMPGVTVGQAVDFLEGAGEEAAGRLQPRLSRRLPPICAGRQSARDHLRLRADHHLPGAGGAVRKPARSAGHHDQRADGDRRRVDSAVLRRGDDEHLHPGRLC